MKDGEVAAQHTINIELVQPNAMIGHAVLRSVVCANLFASITASDERLARNRVRTALTLLFCGQKSASQDCETFLFVA